MSGGRHYELPQLLTVQEVAKALKVGDSMVYKLIKQGKFNARKISWGWRIDITSVASYLDVSLRLSRPHVSDEEAKRRAKAALEMIGCVK